MGTSVDAVIECGFHHRYDELSVECVDGSSGGINGRGRWLMNEKQLLLIVA